MSNNGKYPSLYIRRSSEKSETFEYFYGFNAEEVLFNKTFQFAKPFSNGYALVYKDGEWDIINEKGRNPRALSMTDKMAFILECITPLNGHRLIGYVIGDNLVLSVNPKTLYTKLKSIFKQKFDFLEEYTELDSIIVVYKFNNKFTINGTDINVLEDISYSDDENELIGIKQFGKKWGFIKMDDFDRLVFSHYEIEPYYDYVAPFSEGLAKVKKNGRFGFINKRGELVIDFDFDDARSFSGGYAPVAISNHRGTEEQKAISFRRRWSAKRWNYIDIQGNRVEGYGNKFCRLARVENIDLGFFAIIDSERERIKRIVGIDEEDQETLRSKFRSDEAFDSYTITKEDRVFGGSVLESNIFNKIPEKIGLLEQLSPIFNITRNKFSSKEIGFKETTLYPPESLMWFSNFVKEAPMVVDSYYFDFDLTQEEMDIMLCIDSLELYGQEYLDYIEQVNKRRIDAQSSRERDFEIERRNIGKEFRKDLDNEAPGWEWNID